MVFVKVDEIWVILDVEGPQLLNDNAWETTVALAKGYPNWDKIAPEIVIIPSPTEEGMTLGEIIAARFYQRLSVIDDIWGDFHRILQDPTYSSGHTLKVVLSFYKAMGATSQWLYEFAKKSLRVVPNIDWVLAHLKGEYNVWMISTSYEFFIRAFCDSVGFDFRRTHCTAVNEFDTIPISKKEARTLLAFMREVAAMPVIEYNKETGEVIPEHQAHYDRFTSFIWETVYSMPVGELLRSVLPVGQTQKREAMEWICHRWDVPKEKVMYVGDSQTDIQCAEWLQGVGLVMMFNAKGVRVCRLADVMYIGEDARAIAWVANLFAREGRQGVIDYYKLPRSMKDGELLTTVTPENVEELEAISVRKRRGFRGVGIGGLT